MNSQTTKTNNYRITVEELNANSKQRSMQFEVQDREDIFEAVEKIKKGSGLEEQLATPLAVALRLLGPIMMQNRKLPLFVDFMPHFKQFMIKLKSIVK